MDRRSVDLCEGCICAENCHSESCEFFSVGIDTDENEKQATEFFFSLHLPKQENPLDVICNAETINEWKEKRKMEINEGVIINSLSLPKKEGMGRRFSCNTRVLRTL